MAFVPAFCRVSTRTHSTACSLPRLKRKTFRLLATKRFLTPTVSEGCGSAGFSLRVLILARTKRRKLKHAPLVLTARESRCGGRDPGNAGRRATSRRGRGFR